MVPIGQLSRYSVCGKDLCCVGVILATSELFRLLPCRYLYPLWGLSDVLDVRPGAPLRHFVMSCLTFNPGPPLWHFVMSCLTFNPGPPLWQFVMSCLTFNPGPFLSGLCDVVLDVQPGLKICIIYYTFFYSIKNLRLYSNCKLLLD